MTELNEQRLRRSLEQAAGEVTGAGDPTATWQRASHRVAQRRRRRRTASAAAAVLVVGFAAAATVPQILGSDMPGEPDVVDIEPAPEAGPADEQPDGGSDREPDPGTADVEMATTSCVDSEHGVAIDYPADWHTDGSGCGLFGPEPLDIEEGIGGSGGFAGVRITRDVLARDLDAHRDDLDGPGVAELVDVDERTVNGRRAVRWESIASGQVGLPEGARSVGWAIELDAQRTMVLSTDDAGDEPERFERDVAVLDAMAESVRSLDDG